MAQSHVIPGSPKSELQPPCAKCGAPMWLVRLSKFDDAHDLRTFKCQVCEHIQSAVAEFK
jgi:hypothetical protein